MILNQILNWINFERNSNIELNQFGYRTGLPHDHMTGTHHHCPFCLSGKAEKWGGVLLCFAGASLAHKDTEERGRVSYGAAAHTSSQQLHPYLHCHRYSFYNFDKYTFILLIDAILTLPLYCFICIFIIGLLIIIKCTLTN